MQTLRRTQVTFDDNEDLAEIISQMIVEATDFFGGFDTQDTDIVNLVEDLTNLEVWEVVEIFNQLLEEGEEMTQFVTEALTRWEAVDPDFYDQIIDCLDDE